MKRNIHTKWKLLIGNDLNSSVDVNIVSARIVNYSGTLNYLLLAERGIRILDEI